jgi:hypothetical protein
VPGIDEVLELGAVAVAGAAPPALQLAQRVRILDDAGLAGGGLEALELAAIVGGGDVLVGAAQAGFEVAGRLAVFQPSRRRLILLRLGLAEVAMASRITFSATSGWASSW